MRRLRMYARSEVAMDIDGNFGWQRVIGIGLGIHRELDFVWLYRSGVGARTATRVARQRTRGSKEAFATNVLRVTIVHRAWCYRILAAAEVDNSRFPGVPSCRFCKLRGQAL
jgi:hypothetical protein